MSRSPESIRDLHPGASGLTLTELLIVLGVFGLVLAAALPGFRRMMDGHRHSSSVSQVTSRVFLTRQMAVRERVPHVMTVDVANSRLLVFQDDDEDGVFDAGERQYGPYPMMDGIQLANVDWVNSQMTFNPNGSTDQTGDIRVLDQRGRSRTIRVSSITGNAEVLP